MHRSDGFETNERRELKPALDRPGHCCLPTPANSPAFAEAELGVKMPPRTRCGSGVSPRGRFEAPLANVLRFPLICKSGVNFEAVIRQTPNGDLQQNTCHLQPVAIPKSRRAHGCNQRRTVRYQQQYHSSWCEDGNTVDGPRSAMPGPVWTCSKDTTGRALWSCVIPNAFEAFSARSDPFKFSARMAHFPNQPTIGCCRAAIG